MKKQVQVWGLLLAFVAYCPFALSQEKKPAPGPSSTTQQSATEQKNIQEYIELLRSNVRQEKAQVMGAVMQLSAGDAAKFWPIYNEYDSELTKLNKMRSDNILEYAKVYQELTEPKADELMKNAIQYQKLRLELLDKYYGRVKQSIGSIEAVRFFQIENQLLMIIDLQIASNLPLFEESKAAQGEKR